VQIGPLQGFPKQRHGVGAQVAKCAAGSFDPVRSEEIHRLHQPVDPFRQRLVFLSREREKGQQESPGPHWHHQESGFRHPVSLYPIRRDRRLFSYPSLVVGIATEAPS
jgi:hypothetical protein